jgi:hyperosmotically inducible protein
MVRALLRIILLIVVGAAIAAFFLGYRFADRGRVSGTEDTVGTTGGVVVERDRSDGVDLGRARETGARIGESLAVGASRAERLARDGGLTAKIKSKMALDDLVKARTIDVDTIDGAVTLSGSVSSTAEHDRAMQLARETEGVTSVTDRLTIER